MRPTLDGNINLTWNITGQHGAPRHVQAPGGWWGHERFDVQLALTRGPATSFCWPRHLQRAVHQTASGTAENHCIRGAATRSSSTVAAVTDLHVELLITALDGLLHGLANW
jgi:hypothetical protein